MFGSETSLLLRVVVCSSVGVFYTPAFVRILAVSVYLL